MGISNLDEAFVHTLKDIYYAEKHIYKAQPKVAKKVSDSELKAALEHHHEETKTHVERLEKVFSLIGEKAKGEKCPAIEGILDEVEELMGEAEKGETLDAVVIGAAQAVEHYEIARYGTLIAWAKQLGHSEAVKLLEETLEEEKSTDKKLTRLGTDHLNRLAA